MSITWIKMDKHLYIMQHFKVQYRSISINFDFDYSIIYSHVGKKKVTDLLIKSGANPSLVDSKGKTALNLAALKGIKVCHNTKQHNHSKNKSKYY